MPPEGLEPPRESHPRRSERRASAVSPRRHTRLRRESNPLRAGLQPAALPVSYKSQSGLRTDDAPTRESRVSCENATRPPACKKQSPHLANRADGAKSLIPWRIGSGPVLRGLVGLPRLRTPLSGEMPNALESAGWPEIRGCGRWQGHRVRSHRPITSPQTKNRATVVIHARTLGRKTCNGTRLPVQRHGGYQDDLQSASPGDFSGLPPLRAARSPARQLPGPPLLST